MLLVMVRVLMLRLFRKEAEFAELVGCVGEV